MYVRGVRKTGRDIVTDCVHDIIRELYETMFGDWGVGGGLTFVCLFILLSLNPALSWSDNQSCK